MHYGRIFYTEKHCEKVVGGNSSGIAGECGYPDQRSDNMSEDGLSWLKCRILTFN